MEAFVIVASFLAGPCLADVSHVLLEHSRTTLTITTTPPPPPPSRPYSFQYQAGRFPGHADRVHREESDGSGIIHGSYSFVDPKHKVRTVEYVADRDGFHPSLINYEDTSKRPVDSDAVKLAKEKHLRLYQRIAQAYAYGAASTNLPKDSATVARAKDKHAKLFDRIAEEHAAIAAQREAERLAYEATSVANNMQVDVDVDVDGDGDGHSTRSNPITQLPVI